MYICTAVWIPLCAVFTVRVIWVEPIETQRSWLRDSFPDHISNDSDVAGVTTWNSQAASLSCNRHSISCDMCNIYCCTPTFKGCGSPVNGPFTRIKFLWQTLAWAAQALVLKLFVALLVLLGYEPCPTSPVATRLRPPSTSPPPPLLSNRSASSWCPPTVSSSHCYCYLGDPQGSKGEGTTSKISTLFVLQGGVRVIWVEPIETQRSWLRDSFPDHIPDDSDVAGVTTWNSRAASLSRDRRNISCDVCNIYCCTPTFKGCGSPVNGPFTRIKLLWQTLACAAQALVLKLFVALLVQLLTTTYPNDFYSCMFQRQSILALARKYILENS